MKTIRLTGWLFTHIDMGQNYEQVQFQIYRMDDDSILPVEYCFNADLIKEFRFEECKKSEFDVECIPFVIIPAQQKGVYICYMDDELQDFFRLQVEQSSIDQTIN